MTLGPQQFLSLLEAGWSRTVEQAHLQALTLGSPETEMWWILISLNLPQKGIVKAEVGFEPTNDGFAIRSLRPLGHSAENEQDTQPRTKQQHQALFAYFIRPPNHNRMSRITLPNLDKEGDDQHLQNSNNFVHICNNCKGKYKSHHSVNRRASANGCRSSKRGFWP